MIDQSERAAILSKALPYIQKFSEKTVVVKYGGAAMTDDSLKHAVISDIVLLSLTRIKMVVVHGGGPEINDLLVKIGKKPKFIDGLRETDDETMDVVQMVLSGKISKNLVALAEGLGGKAVSISGIDGGLMRAKQLDPKYGQVGEITSVSPELIKAALDIGFIPIISTVALSEDNNSSYNINADTAAGKIAESLDAERLILLTDVRGILKDPTDDQSLITEIKVSDVPSLVESGIISGGMKPKIDCCVDAINNGVRRAHILDGRLPHSILMEMLTDGGVGTMITG